MKAPQAIVAAEDRSGVRRWYLPPCRLARQGSGDSGRWVPVARQLSVWSVQLAQLVMVLTTCLLAGVATGQSIADGPNWERVVTESAVAAEPGDLLAPHPVATGMSDGRETVPQFSGEYHPYDQCDEDGQYEVCDPGYGYVQEGLGSQMWNSLSPSIRNFIAGLRPHHSSTDGRTSGGRLPYPRSSWLNRPYYVGIAGGGVYMVNRPQQNVRSDNDLFGQVTLGWDWDYYWGLECRVGRASPELKNSLNPNVIGADRMVMVDLSVIYYPFGDTRVRPYWRAGVGGTAIDYVNDSGVRDEAAPFTVPFGLGVKWPIQRWLAGRIELVDNLAFADDSIDTMNNVTLVIGAELRFGDRPRTYWPWYPGR